MFNSIKARVTTIAIAAVLSASVVGADAQATNMTGAGSTFVYPVLSKWSAAYSQKTGDQLNYQSIGSGGGIAQIKAGTVDFGASDKPLPSAELAASGLGQFPAVIGGIVPVLNIPGMKSGQVKLTGAVLANIYLGKIGKWNDPAIAALNPGVALPSAAITVVHRSDGSGTTFNFTDYLSKVSPEWKSKVGENTAVQWPSGIGGKGNEGVSAYVKQIKNSIGYVEYAYALQNHMAYALLQNAAGRYVVPSLDSFAAAAATADWASAKDFNLVMTNAPGPNAFPIAATTWIIMYKHPKKPAQSKAVFAFFRWAYANGQAQAQSLDYVPLPPTLVARIETYWKAEFKL